MVYPKQGPIVIVFLLVTLISLILGLVGVLWGWRFFMSQIIKHYSKRPPCPPKASQKVSCLDTPSNWMSIESKAGFSIKYPPECRLSKLDDPYPGLDDPYPGKIQIIDPEGNSFVEIVYSNKETLLLGKERKVVDLSKFEEIICARTRELDRRYRLHTESLKRIRSQAGTEGILVTRLPSFQLPTFPEDPYYQHAYFESKDGSKIIEIKAKINSTPYITAETFKKVICSLQYTTSPKEGDS